MHDPQESYRFLSAAPDNYRDGMTTLKRKALLLLNSDKNVQDLPSLLFAQATTAVEECDATKLK